MRVVADTNVVVSAFLWGGNPQRLLETARRGQIRLYTSRALIEEMERVLTRDKFSGLLRQSRFSPAYLISRYSRLAQLIAVSAVEAVITVDPDDDHVLACAIAAKADLIVSGDRHLLDLKHYRDIAIVSPAEALKRIAITD